jgi:dihydroneopterin aldolase
MRVHQDYIELADIELDVIVGILDFERITPQPVIIDLKLYLDLDACGDTGDLGKSIDYAAVLDQVRAVAEEGRWRLIESMALALCCLFLAHPAPGENRAAIERLDVRIRKPKVLGGVAVPGIAITRNAKWCFLERTQLLAGVDAERQVQPATSGAWRVHIGPGASWELPKKCAAHVIAGDLGGLSAGSRIPRGGRVLMNRGELAATLLVLGRLQP